MWLRCKINEPMGDEMVGIRASREMDASEAKGWME